MLLIPEFEKLSKEMAHIPIYLKEMTKEEKLEQPLFLHMSKYSQLQFSDVYKFLYQGSCGWAHLSKLGDDSHIREYLTKELSEVTEITQYDEIFEILDYETGLGRVNLRVWKQYFGEDTDLLWKLMIIAQQNTPTNTNLFIKRWKSLAEWIDQKTITYPSGADELVARWFSLIETIASEVTDPSKLPMLSHSKMYKMYYNPSYRIIREDDLFPV